jgi:hypothetical protein
MDASIRRGERKEEACIHMQSTHDRMEQALLIDARSLQISKQGPQKGS